MYLVQQMEGGEILYRGQCLMDYGLRNAGGNGVTGETGQTKERELWKGVFDGDLHAFLSALSAHIFRFHHDIAAVNR